jgi:hypothetical protein
VPQRLIALLSPFATSTSVEAESGWVWSPSPPIRLMAFFLSRIQPVRLRIALTLNVMPKAKLRRNHGARKW